MRELLNRKIIGKLGAISRREVTPKESNIGLLFNNLKTIDEALYITLISRYKKTLDELES